jgi:serine/threonine protein kinase
MKPAVLTLRTKEKKVRFELTPDELVTVGRSSSCRIQLADASVSREHCVVIYTNGKICINDLQSTHGISQDGERVSRVELLPGDECRLGNALARFELEAGAHQPKPRQAITAPPAAPRPAAAPTPDERRPADAVRRDRPEQPEIDAQQAEEPAVDERAPTMASIGDEPARTIAGYRVFEKIGEGGFGTVYRAEQTQLGRQVALKILKKGDDAEHQQRIDAFLREARIAAQLSDPRLVQVYDVGESDGEHFLSMELVEGGSLARRIKREGPLDWQQSLRLLRDLTHALKAAHDAGLVHRDVKPGNVLLTEKGQAKLTDLGLAAGDAHAGTIAFMAPEQLRREAVDGRADIYALGCTIYAALAGAPPFGGDRKEMARAQVRQSPPSLLDQGVQVPYQLHQLILQSMLAKDPADRPQDAEALLRRIDRLILPSNVAPDRDEGEEDYPSVAPSRSPRQRRQKELGARLAAEAVIFSIIAAVVIAILLLLKVLSPSLDIYRLIGR